MACADVATAKAKPTAINLIILFSYVNLHEERFLKQPIWLGVALAKSSGRKTRIEMQAVLMRGKGLNNIAARVLEDAGRDLDKALEIVADRMIDEDAT